MLAKKRPGSHIQVTPADYLDRLDEIVDRYAGKSEYLIPALKDAQDTVGYLPLDVQSHLARGLHVTPAHVYGVVTFYSFFTMVPRGRHTVRLCQGTACYVQGAKGILERIVKELGIEVGETSEDGRFTFEAVRCLGTCGLAPVMVVGEHTHGNVDPEGSLEILQRCK